MSRQQIIHSIREADLKTHDSISGIGQDVCYEEYLLNKLRDDQMLNIKLKYDKLEKKKRKRKFSISLTGIEALLLAVSVVQLSAFMLFTYKGKQIQAGVEENVANAAYQAIIDGSGIDEDNDTENYLKDLIQKF